MFKPRKISIFICILSPGITNKCLHHTNPLKYHWKGTMLATQKTRSRPRLQVPQTLTFRIFINSQPKNHNFKGLHQPLFFQEAFLLWFLKLSYILTTLYMPSKCHGQCKTFKHMHTKKKFSNQKDIKNRKQSQCYK